MSQNRFTGGAKASSDFYVQLHDPAEEIRAQGLNVLKAWDAASKWESNKAQEQIQALDAVANLERQYRQNKFKYDQANNRRVRDQILANEDKRIENARIETDNTIRKVKGLTDLVLGAGQTAIALNEKAKNKIQKENDDALSMLGLDRDTESLKDLTDAFLLGKKGKETVRKFIAEKFGNNTEHAKLAESIFLTPKKPEITKRALLHAAGQNLSTWINQQGGETDISVIPSLTGEGKEHYSVHETQNYIDSLASSADPKALGMSATLRRQLKEKHRKGLGLSVKEYNKVFAPYWKTLDDKRYTELSTKLQKSTSAAHETTANLEILNGVNDILNGNWTDNKGNPIIDASPQEAMKLLFKHIVTDSTPGPQRKYKTQDFFRRLGVLHQQDKLPEHLVQAALDGVEIELNDSGTSVPFRDWNNTAVSQPIIQNLESIMDQKKINNAEHLHKLSTAEKRENEYEVNKAIELVVKMSPEQILDGSADAAIKAAIRDARSRGDDAGIKKLTSYLGRGIYSDEELNKKWGPLFLYDPLSIKEHELHQSGGSTQWIATNIAKLRNIQQSLPKDDKELRGYDSKLTNIKKAVERKFGWFYGSPNNENVDAISMGKATDDAKFQFQDRYMDYRGAGGMSHKDALHAAGQDFETDLKNGVYDTSTGKGDNLGNVYGVNFKSDYSGYSYRGTISTVNDQLRGQQMYNALKKDKDALEKIVFMDVKNLRAYANYRSDIHNNRVPPRSRPNWGASVWLVGKSDLTNRHQLFEKQIQAWNNLNPTNQIFLEDTNEFDSKQKDINYFSEQVSQNLGENGAERASTSRNQRIAYAAGVVVGKRSWGENISPYVLHVRGA